MARATSASGERNPKAMRVRPHDPSVNVSVRSTLLVGRTSGVEGSSFEPTAGRVRVAEVRYSLPPIREPTHSDGNLT